MSDNSPQKNETPHPLFLSVEAALTICRKNGFEGVARDIVDGLPNRSSFTKERMRSLVEQKLSEVAQSLSKCIDRASQAKSAVEKLPMRSKQGDALRSIKQAIEDLLQVIADNWPLVGPNVELEFAGLLGWQFSTEGVADLLQGELQSEFVRLSDASRGGDTLLELRRSYLLRAGSHPLVQFIELLKEAVRNAEDLVLAGAATKRPFELALVMQLADFFEIAQRRKASATVGGPFSSFCADVFAELGLNSDRGWEYLLREGIQLQRRSLFARRRHEKPVEQNVIGEDVKRKPRKRILNSLSKAKVLGKQ